MKLLNLFTTAILILLFVSCEKIEEAPETPIPLVTEYQKTEEGSYWVYEWVEISPDGSETSMDIVDSVYMESDLLIDGRSFFVQSGTFLGNEQKITFFDSVNSFFSYPERILLFTTDQSQRGTTQAGPQATPHLIGNYALKEGMFSVDVPAGIFTCLNFSGSIELLDNGTVYDTREHAKFYAKDIGLIKETTSYVHSPNILEKRLIRYGKN